MMHGGRGPSRFLAMTSFRLVLLVLLALLLPLRGVSAMVLPCGPMPGSAAEAVVSSPHHQDAHRDHGHSEGVAHHDHTGAQQGCQGQSCCPVTPLPAAMPALSDPRWPASCGLRNPPPPP
jgi:hypothetical protein